MRNYILVVFVALLGSCASPFSQERNSPAVSSANTAMAAAEFNFNEYEFFVDGTATAEFSKDLQNIPSILRTFFQQYAVGERTNDGCPVAGVREAKEAYLEQFETGDNPFPEWYGAITSFNVYPLSKVENVFEGEVELCSWHRMSDGKEDSLYIKMRFGKHKVGEQVEIVEHPYLVLVKKIPNKGMQVNPADPLGHLTSDPFPGTLKPSKSVNWENLLQMIESRGYQYKLHASGHEFMASMIVEASINGISIDMSDESIDKRDDCFDLFFDNDFLSKRTKSTGGWSSPPEHGSTCLGRCDVGIIATAG